MTDPQTAEVFASGKTSLWRAGSTTTAMTALNVVVGFAFQSLLALQLGLTKAADDFQFAYVATTFVTTSIATAVPSQLLPMAVRGGSPYNGRDRRAFWFLGLALLLAQAAAGAVVLTLGSRSIGLSLILASLSHPFATAAAFNQVIAYRQRRFLLAAAGPVANGIGLTMFAGGLILFAAPSASLYSLGLSVGYLAQWAATVVGGVPNRSDVSRTVRAHDLVGSLLFAGLTKFGPLVERYLTVGMATGSAAALGYASKFTQGILMVSAFGISLVGVTTISELLHRKDITSLVRVLRSSVLSVTVITSLTIVLAAPALLPAVRLLLGRGEFTTADARYVTAVALAFLPWVACNSAASVFTTFLYASNARHKILGVAAVGVLATIVVGLIARPLGAFGVALGSSAGAASSLSLASWLVHRLLRKRFGTHGLGQRDVLHWLLAMTPLAILSAAATFADFTHPRSWPITILSLTLLLVAFAIWWVSMGSGRRSQLKNVLSTEV